MADSGDNYRPPWSLGETSVILSSQPLAGESREEFRRQRSPMTGVSAPGGGSNTGYTGGAQHQRSFEDRQAAKEQRMSSIRETSQQDRRVYVGNLSYDVKWHHLKDFMRQAGEVLFAEVLLLPNGMSKAPQVAAAASVAACKAVILAMAAVPLEELPYNVGWQDLKDLFRQAARSGAVIRADVHIGPDGRPKGSGIVVYESPDDARNAIAQFNGYDWQGRLLELPWSTSNDDLVDLFSTIGKVEQAEIQYEPSGRSRGTGVVRFETVETAETSITKFQGYQYGNRPLGLSFVRYLHPGGGEDSMDTDNHGGLTQDQIM
ncbi:unnamed protein product [Parascedosporium putredinis]|uniref:RRM domain-containing protein n=1 Tax=Parascedosporium putredinis TaxID=1442378 RepID=A0A9P1M9D0_9PEZI|nr:unnamed protein product [Parascedosporium putredinis]CAI7994602.1 unnamed protein product [Parascedosporium putredinis]